MRLHEGMIMFKDNGTNRMCVETTNMHNSASVC